MYLILFGLMYGLVTVLGFAQGEGELLGLVAINVADNYLHLGIAAVCLVLGFASSKNALHLLVSRRDRL